MQKVMKKITSFSLALVMLFMFTACKTTEQDKDSNSNTKINSQESSKESETSIDESEKLKIYTSFYPMYEWTKKIVGDTAEVINIMPPGSSSHGWIPTAQMVKELSQDDILVYQGANMEEWFDSVKETLDAEGSDLIYIEASEGIELHKGFNCGCDPNDPNQVVVDIEEYGYSTFHKDHFHWYPGHVPAHAKISDRLITDKSGEVVSEHDAGQVVKIGDDYLLKAKNKNSDKIKDIGSLEDLGLNLFNPNAQEFDPHVWLSPREAIKMLGNIYSKLVEISPENVDLYTNNYENYVKELQGLDAKFSALNDKGVDSFMITHQALGYLGKDYGLIQYGLTGMGTEQDPNPEKMAEFVKIIKSHGWKAIFYDDAGSDKVARILAAEVGDLEVLPLTTLHSPTEVEMAEGIDYIKAMERNLNNLLANAK